MSLWQLQFPAVDPFQKWQVQMLDKENKAGEDNPGAFVHQSNASFPSTSVWILTSLWGQRADAALSPSAQTNICLRRLFPTSAAAAGPSAPGLDNRNTSRRVRGQGEVVLVPSKTLSCLFSQSLNGAALLPEEIMKELNNTLCGFQLKIITRNQVWKTFWTVCSYKGERESLKTQQLGVKCYRKTIF